MKNVTINDFIRNPLPKKITAIISLFLSFAIAFSFSINAFAQLPFTNKINPVLLQKAWAAKWITSPNISGKEFGVYLFRKTFILPVQPKQFIVHVSADNRYKLYVNEQYVGNGSAKSDLQNWNFESIDIAPFLKQGSNIITAIVWNFGDNKPLAQISNQTGFILQGDAGAENTINTDKRWRVFKDAAYSPLNTKPRDVGPSEKFNCQAHPWDWQQINCSDSAWSNAKELENGTPNNSIIDYGKFPQYLLQPRTIPAMEEKLQRFSQIRRTDLANIPNQFLNGKEPLNIPPNSTIKILFDQQTLTNAYPVLLFSKGKNSEIKLTYAESLVNEKSEKGNRNDIDKKHIEGKHDIVIADGGNNRTFQTLWWRTFRYLEMEITTKDEPLIINDFHSIFTGYPFEEKATFSCSDTALSNIWTVGWRTQRLCATETYMDCPYYEQLQYVGDARIQALISSYVSGDSRLFKTALQSIHDSYLPTGLTQSRYPSRQVQIIPPFSLIWATMVSDYWMLNKDDQFVQSMIPRIMDVMRWFETKIDATGMLGNMGWWNFVDWANSNTWDKGVPPGVGNSHSAVISLQYVYTLQKVATLLKVNGFSELAVRYIALGESIKSAVFKTCFDKQKGLIADTPEKNEFSQHANALAILTGTVPKEMQVAVMNKILTEKELTQCSFYFGFYITEALEKAGLADMYIETLAPWKQMLNIGLTTFAERPEPTRSDCHAWSASPVYNFLSLVCGIKPNESGFNTVKIEPHLGKLSWVKGSLPHAFGTIQVNLKKDKQGVSGEIILPEKLTGNFIWQGKAMVLKGGINKIQIK